MRNISIASLILMTGCASTANKTEVTKPVMDMTESPNGNSKDQKNADPSKPIMADTAFNWQKFFKGPPSSNERPALQATIKQLEKSSSAEELVKRGRNQFALGLLPAAEASFRQALRKNQKNTDALIELAATLQRQRRIQAALDALAEAREQLSSSETADPAQVFRFRYTLAMTYLANDDRAKAHPILSDLVGKDRTFLPGYAALAFSYLKDNKDSVAKFIVDQAIDRGGDHASLYNILGVLAERQGKPSVAKDQYNRALALNDSYAPALVNRANLYLSSQEAGMAESDYKKALEADPASTDALIGLAVVLRQTGRYSAAREKLERVVDMDGDNPQARFNLAILMRENLKDEGLALRYYNEVLQSERANKGLKSMAKTAIEEIRNI